MENKRISYIDLFRGFGIILMIMGHIGFGKKFDFFIHAFHMPMFFFVSGYFYEQKNISTFRFCFSKFKSLLIPYLAFGLIHEIIYLIMVQDFNVALSPLKHLLFENTDGLPITGALWFLTALFFTEIIYFILDKYIKSMKIKTIIIVFIALLGTVISKYLPFRLPWAMDAAFVGLGLFHFARVIKNSGNPACKALLKLPLYVTLPLGLVATILVFKNGYINMRTASYGNEILFFFIAFMCILVGMNLSRSLDEILSPKLNFLIAPIKYIGKNSITFLCLNQLIIMLINKYLKVIFVFPTKVNHLIVFILTTAILIVVDWAIRKTKLRIILGK